jgi:hypothetical protein
LAQDFRDARDPRLDLVTDLRTRLGGGDPRESEDEGQHENSYLTATRHAALLVREAGSTGRD